MRHKFLTVTTLVFLLVLALSWIFHGTGVVHNDLARNISIPAELTMPLQVKAAYDGKSIVALMPYAATLLSKALFGAVMATVLAQTPLTTSCP